MSERYRYRYHCPMPAIHVRNVPEHVAAAIRERAERHGHSMQQELLEILEAAATQPARGEKPPPIELVTVRTAGTSSWRREEIYGDEGR
jgi:plasmid stability protein